MTELPTNARDMFCFAVYGATHAINRAYGPLLKPLGLTYPQYITLTLLWERDGQAVGELAAQMGMESSTMTPLIKRLEALGHAVRRRGERDERIVYVDLTASGRGLQSEARRITKCMVADTDMTPAELSGLVSKLTMLQANLKNAREV